MSDYQRKTFPKTDDVVVSYISGLVDDEDEEMDDIVEMTRGMLQLGPSNSDNQNLEDLSVTYKQRYLSSEYSADAR